MLQGGHQTYPLADNLGTTLSHNMYTHNSLQVVCETFSEKVEEVTIDLKIIKLEIIEINQRDRSNGTVLKYMVYIYCRTKRIG